MQVAGLPFVRVRFFHLRLSQTGGHVWPNPKNDDDEVEVPLQCGGTLR